MDSHQSLLLRGFELILKRMKPLLQDVSGRRARQEEIISLPGVPAPTARSRSGCAGILIAVKVLLVLEVPLLAGVVLSPSSCVFLDIVEFFPE